MTYIEHITSKCTTKASFNVTLLQPWNVYSIVKKHQKSLHAMLLCDVENAMISCCYVICNVFINPSIKIKLI